MATKKIGQIITRPGRLPGDPPIDIPIPEDLMTVPGSPIRQNEVDFYGSSGSFVETYLEKWENGPLKF